MIFYIGRNLQIEGHERGITVFADILVSIQKLRDPFITKRRPKEVDVFAAILFLSTKKNYRKFPYFKNFFKTYSNRFSRDIAGLDMSLDEIRDLCRVAREREVGFYCSIDSYGKKSERIC